MGSACRALVRLRLGDHAGALADAESALAVQPQSTKALYRAAVALSSLGGAQRLRDALAKAQRAASLDPSNQEVR
jgi:tetratricopeptide (TPR) repeat protein